MLRRKHVEEETSNFEQWVGIAENVSSMLSVTDFGMESRPVGGKPRYTLEYLTHTLLLADLLRNDRELYNAVRVSLRMVLPKPMADFYERVLAEGLVRVPAVATVSHMRLVFDVALMLQQQKQMNELRRARRSPRLYIMTDSSPQAVINWQVTSYCMIHGEDLAPLARECKAFVAHCLSRDRPRVGGKYRLHDDELAAMASINARIHCIYCIPTALGCKRASLGHKLHCLYH